MIVQKRCADQNHARKSVQLRRALELMKKHNETVALRESRGMSVFSPDGAGNLRHARTHSFQTNSTMLRVERADMRRLKKCPVQICNSGV
jgi:hypothetical protein